MKKLILALTVLALCTNFSYGQVWQQLGPSFQTTTVKPILKNLSNGTPIVVHVNPTGNLAIAIFDYSSQDWVYSSFGSFGNVTNLSADIVSDKIFIGCKSSAANYGVYYFDVANSQLNTVSTSFPTYYKNNIAMAAGSFSPMKIAVAYENFDGTLSCLEWNGTSFAFVGGNAGDVTSNQLAYQGLKVSADEKFIHVVTNVDNDMELPLRVFVKQFGSTGNFTEPTGSPIDNFGANLFTVSNSKIDQGFQPTYNYVENNVNTFNLIQTRKHQTTNSLTANQTNFDAYYGVLEMAAVSDEVTNYVFYTEDSQNTLPNRVIKSESGNAFTTVGGGLSSGSISLLSMGMNYTTKKPYVGYYQSGIYTVKTFNQPPSFEAAGTPNDLCKNSMSEIVLDYLLFLDDDGDQLHVSDISSSNTALIATNNIIVTQINYDPINGSNEFEIEAMPTAGETGTTFITVEFTDGIEFVAYNFEVSVNPTYSKTDQAAICNGDTYLFGTQSLTLTGTYTEVFSSVDGCDSLVTLSLTVNPTYSETDQATICNGDTYLFGTQSLTSTGTYTEVFTSVDGCDSLVMLSLTVNPTYNETDQATICEGSSYLFGTQSLTQEGVYNETFQSVSGCDSVVTLTLNVVSPEFTLPSNEICSNNGAITLMNYVTPIGGNFSGPGVSNNKFFPNQVAPNNTYTITYSRYYSVLGCTAFATETITVKPAPSISVLTTPATCGESDGAATANFNSAGSSAGHNVYWSNGISEQGVSTSTISDLEPGLYFVNATNEFGCSATAPATVSSSNLLISGTAQPVSCFNGSDGAINLSITSTAGVSSINWSNGATSEDISNLPAGPYEVTVIDNEGCQSTATFNVSSPARIICTSSVTASSCGNSDGSATVIVQGGTAPYTYQWFNGQGNQLPSTSDTQSNLPAGNYLCSVSDQNGCSKVISIVISDVGSPTVELNELTNASCANDGAIDIDIISSSAIQSITWSNGATTEDITNLSPDNYSVYVMDENGCAGMLSVDVEPVLPSIQPVCLVTVDTLTTTNKIVWEREQLTGIATFNIYRETSQANVYQLVHSQAYADESEWTDTVASPMVRSWRYQLSAVDLCGNESELSPVHKTIHLSINAGIGSNVNLAWDSYEGFPYTQFNIWRHTDPTGWVLLTSLPSNLFSYTDIGVLGIAGLDYIIEVVPAELCTSEKAQDYNSSRSNKTTGKFNDDGSGNVGLFNYLVIEKMAIYPNPASEELTIDLSVLNSTGITAQIVDATGRILTTIQLMNGENTINIAYLDNGVYFIKTDDVVGANKIMKFIKN